MTPRDAIRFDGWTLDVRTGELERDGRRIRLQLQPQQVLEELLACPGELVTRQRLIARLWPRGVVDFDTALNSAVRRLRTALDDHAESPRYIETIPRRGYRYIGPLAMPGREAQPVRLPPPRPLVSHRLRWPTLATLVALALAASGTLSQVGGRSTVGDGAGAQVDPRAGERVVRARHFLHRRLPGDLARAKRTLQEAIALEPQYAPAWAGLASAEWLLAVAARPTVTPDVAPVRDAALRALELDPGLAEAHVRLAGYLQHVGNHREADRHLERALALEPANALVLAVSAGHAASAGRLDEAVALQRRALESAPLSQAYRQTLVAWLVMDDRLDEAREELQRLREIEPAAPELPVLLATVLILEGRYDEALALAATMPDVGERSYTEALAYHGLGRPADADAALRSLAATAADRDAHARVAEVLAFRGQREAAFARLASPSCHSAAHPSCARCTTIRAGTPGWRSRGRSP
jgi:DNA-binding winged helix-turn-helix (wHTH) protein/Tfp pilus assembly protein PilF